MPKLPDIYFDSIRPVALHLPPDRYLVKLVEIERFHARNSKRPCFRWWWEIMKGQFKGQQIDSYTGVGTKESDGRMNHRLKRHFRALRLEYIEDFNPNDLINMRVTIDVEEIGNGRPEIDSMMPAEFYKYSRNWKPNGWHL
jgi:hypothetical protein